jgi:UTP--glucose-1-phosphate uridylyltransferase
MVNVHYIRQKEPRGLPDAILQAEKHIGNDPFAVLLGDDIIKAETPCIGQLITVFEKHGKSVLAVQQVPLDKISRYGCIEGDRISTEKENNLYDVKNIIEKPRPDEAPSNIAAIGRYVFTPQMFECIKKTQPTLNNELVIAESINILLRSQQVLASEFDGRRYDIGDKAGYIQAVIDYALEKPDIKEEIIEFLKKRR